MLRAAVAAGPRLDAALVSGPGGERPDHMKTDCSASAIEANLEFGYAETMWVAGGADRPA